jgi:hypothetical protein
MRQLTLNVQANPPMPQAQVVDDVQRAAALSGCIGWQEIKLERYRQAIRDIGPPWHHIFGPGELALSFRGGEFELIERGFLQATNGRAHITPNRYVSWAIMHHKPSGHRVVRFNTHAISGAWTPHPVPEKAFRRREWHHHMNVLADAVRLMADSGHPVIVGGDINRSGFEFLGDLVIYDNDFDVPTHREGTIDYLCHRHGGGVRAERRGHEVVKGFHSDHDAVLVNYALVT